MFSIFKEPVGFSSTILRISQDSLAKTFSNLLNRNWKVDGAPVEGTVVFHDNKVRYHVSFTFAYRKDAYVRRTEIIYYYVSIYNRISGNYIGSFSSDEVYSREVQSHILAAFWQWQRKENENELKMAEQKKLQSTEIIRKYS